MSKLIAFKYAGKSKKIKITPSAGYDRILSQVAQSFGLVAVELEYEDTADGEVYILSPDEELEETFAQNFKWKVAAPAQAPDVENIHNKDDSGSSLAVSNAASNETDDPHDSNISPKKGRF
ncbi:hypothetical protein DFJ73DRAFT_770972 [Zopfochytrium polystomum]|nr:hypothetical protein DFJ73DRAFT_770972 [Zopfochytrium polystomum]